MQLHALGARRVAWLRAAAEALFLCTCATGWAGANGDFYYTLDRADKSDRPERSWWPCCKGIAAAAVNRASGGGQAFAASLTSITRFTGLPDSASAAYGQRNARVGHRGVETLESV